MPPPHESDAVRRTRPRSAPCWDQRKHRGPKGIHHLAPYRWNHFRERRRKQLIEREGLGDASPTHTYEDADVSMVFTTTCGRLVNRQSVTKEIERAAKAADLDPSGLASHTGRRTVITALYADGRLDLADVARHVGHSDTATTAEYVRSLGQRPADTARRAAELLDPTVFEPGSTRTRRPPRTARRSRTSKASTTTTNSSRT